MKKKILFLCGAIVLFLNACKKDNPTTQEKIIGIWKIGNVISTSVTGNVSNTITYTGKPSDYIDFRADNKVYSSINGDKDTSAYTIANNVVTYIGDPGTTPLAYTIKNLTNLALQLYMKNILSATDYLESTVNLKK